MSALRAVWSKSAMIHEIDRWSRRSDSARPRRRDVSQARKFQCAIDRLRPRACSMPEKVCARLYGIDLRRIISNYDPARGRSSVFGAVTNERGKDATLTRERRASRTAPENLCTFNRYPVVALAAFSPFFLLESHYRKRAAARKCENIFKLQNSLAL